MIVQKEESQYNIMDAAFAPRPLWILEGATSQIETGILMLMVQCNGFDDSEGKFCA